MVGKGACAAFRAANAQAGLPHKGSSIRRARCEGELFQRDRCGKRAVGLRLAQVRWRERRNTETRRKSYVTPGTIKLADIPTDKLCVTHFYGLDEVRYEGVVHMALGRFTRWPYALLRFRRSWNQMAQRLFNRRALVASSRIKILRDVVEMTSAGEASEVDSLDLMSHRYGYRWTDHPGWESHQSVLDFHLSCLAESGELALRIGRYRPTGMALKALEEFDEEERKHRANWRVQILLAFLAFLGLVAAAGQAGLFKAPTLLDLRSPKDKQINCVEKVVETVKAVD